MACAVVLRHGRSFRDTPRFLRPVKMCFGGSGGFSSVPRARSSPPARRRVVVQMRCGTSGAGETWPSRCRVCVSTISGAREERHVVGARYRVMQSCRSRAVTTAMASLDEHGVFSIVSDGPAFAAAFERKGPRSAHAEGAVSVPMNTPGLETLVSDDAVKRAAFASGARGGRAVRRRSSGRRCPATSPRTCGRTCIRTSRCGRRATPARGRDRSTRSPGAAEASTGSAGRAGKRRRRHLRHPSPASRSRSLASRRSAPAANGSAPRIAWWLP